MAVLPFVVDRVGVCRSKRLHYVTLFQRGRVKLSTKYRVWPVKGDDRYIELDPSQWREKYEVLAWEPTSEPGRPN